MDAIDSSTIMFFWWISCVFPLTRLPSANLTANKFNMDVSEMEVGSIFSLFLFCVFAIHNLVFPYIIYFSLLLHLR